jgi:hypothetical protein
MATHLVVKKSGDGAYTTIAAAIAATTSGGVGDWSTITIADDGIYDELIDFGALDYVRIIAADNCTIAPNPPNVASPVTMGSSAPANIQFDVANGAKPVLAPAASQADKLPIFAWGQTHAVDLLVNGWKMAPTAGTGWLIAEGKAPGSAVKFDSCEASDGPWTTDEMLKLDKAVSLTVLDCNMENVETAEVFAQIGPETVVDIQRSSIEADTLLAIEGPTAGTGGELSIINNIFVLRDVNKVFLDLSDGVNATGGLIAHNLFMRLGEPSTQVTAIKTPYNNVDVSNNIFMGLGIVGTIDGAVTATANNNCVYDCNAGFVGNWAEVGTVSTDPKLGDGDLEPDSPCIDAGVDIPTVTVDILGRPRPSPEGGKWDIGPCEFQHEDPDPPDPPDPDPEPEPGNELINATFVREVAENVWLIYVK